MIEKLRRKIKQRSKNIKIGIGDDCAVITGSGRNMLFTTDILIENIHFDLKYFSPEILGEKAIAVNLSDIAAMGGAPLYILISLGIPVSTRVKFIEKLYEGFESMADKYSCSIIGGDISSSYSGLIINITIIGDVKKNAYTSRAGARIKDKIFLTGTVGDSAAGLELLKRGKKIKNKLTEKHLSPKPRLKEGKILAEETGVSSMIDISDGLFSDLKRICEESKCGAKIYMDKIPISRSLHQWEKPINNDIFDYALYGGEDYELLFTVGEKKIKNLQKRWQKMKIPITCIGEISSKKNSITLVYPGGKEKPIFKTGYDHFKK